MEKQQEINQPMKHTSFALTKGNGSKNGWLILLLIVGAIIVYGDRIYPAQQAREELDSCIEAEAALVSIFASEGKTYTPSTEKCINLQTLTMESSKWFHIL